MPSKSKTIQSRKPLKGGTASSKKHTFQSFTQKVATIKIDPIRRVRRHIEDEESTAETSSFFHASLVEWIDLNLSATFTDFTRQVKPWSESLPHVIYHQDKIMDALVKFIDEGDDVGMEPLLSLLSQFARDLGVEFEKHFQRAVELLLRVVTKRTAVDVVEYAFNSLAYLLKYLSRLLVPDLRPLFDILSPLLGKSTQKPHLTRFAAEAFSFLLRKAREEPLKLIVDHICVDLVRSSNSENNSKQGREQYTHGLSILFTEACMGVDHHMHSRGPNISKALLQEAVEDFGAKGLERSDNARQVIRLLVTNVIVGLTHRMDQSTYGALLEVVFGFFDEKLLPSSKQEDFSLAAAILHCCIGTRKGSRIENWAPLMERTEKLLKKCASNGLQETMWEASLLAAIALQLADLPNVVGKYSGFIKLVQNFRDGALFLPFCDFFASMGSERFGQFLLSEFQRFSYKFWSSYEDSLCLLIPKFCAQGLLKSNSSAYIEISAPMEAGTKNAFKELKTRLTNEPAAESHFDESTEAIKCYQYLEVLNVFAELGANLSQNLEKILNGGLSTIMHSLETKHLDTSKVAVLVGKILNLAGSESQIINSTIVKDLIGNFEILGGNDVFIQGFNKATVHSGFQRMLDESSVEKLLVKLEQNLSSPQHETRSTSLDLISRLILRTSSSEPEPLSLMKLIEDTPLSLSSSRAINMHIRKLGVACSAMDCHQRVAKMGPLFCFGLLTIRFAALWDDTISTLKTLGEKQEELIASIAITWLEAKFSKSGSDSKAEESNSPGSLTDFECSNLSLLVKKADEAMDSFSNAKYILSEKFENIHEQIISPSFARTQSLKLLCEVPHIAERRSRRIVPMFLDWYHTESLDNTEEDDDVASVKRTKNDKTAMLTLFSKFNNPKSLYKTEAVFSTLLDCLTSGDAKTQGLALKAIYSWKLPGVRPYEENLNHLVDEDRFREEITNFIQVRAEESKIQDDHREQLMPVLLRVLYGRSLARKNSSSNSRGMESRRTVVLAALTNFPQSDLDMFLEITLGPLANLQVFNKITQPYSVHKESFSTETMSLRKQLGFVNMMEDLFKQMGTTLLPFAGKLMDAIFYCVVLASQNINKNKVEDAGTDGPSEKSSRTIRQVGFRCLNALFTNCGSYEWDPYMPTFFSELVNPRLDALPMETAQAPSGMLQLFSNWASSPFTAHFLYSYNTAVLPNVAECLSVESVKDSVVLFVLDIVHKLVDLVDDEEVDTQAFRQHLIAAHVDLFIVKISKVLQKSPSKDVLDKGISAVARLSPYATGQSETEHLVELSLFLLSQPTRRVNPKSKSDILKIVSNILPHYLGDMNEEQFDKAYRTITSLFGFFHDKESRELLSKIMTLFTEKDESLVEVAGLCDDLNSYSKRAFGEPDFDRRLKAFSSINEDRFGYFAVRQWIPLVNNMLFFIRDQEELVIRTSASYTLRRFAESCAKNQGGADENPFLDLLSTILFPAVLRGSREASELIRMEYVSVMAHIVQECSFWPEVADMKSLLVGGDEEANFFFNILHVQQHRRIKALKRLAATARRERLNTTNITQFFIPLAEHFVFDQDEGAHNLATDAINTIGVLAEQLEWNQFRALFKRYIGYIKERPDNEKIVIRIIGAVTDALHRAARGVPEKAVSTNGAEKVNVVGDVSDVQMEGASDDDEGEDDEKEGQNGHAEEEDIAMNGVEEEDEDIEMPDGPIASRLSTVLPPKSKLTEDITTVFLPILTNYLHHKDEAMVSLRMPLAISIVKLLHVLPEEEMNSRLSGVLMDICHVLRSRDQGSRDTTRKTLTEISTLLGPKYFGFILKELKGALLRGYQLHVLSYTVHTLLLSVVPQFKIGTINYCAAMIADIVMEDIFGVIGSEKDAEGYTNKMKEVKSSKSYDSMELIASITTAQYLQDLIKPIKGILAEKLTLKIVKKADELLRRMTLGIARNESLKSQELLIFCWQVVEDIYKSQEATKKPERKKTFSEQNRERFIVDTKIHKHKQTTSQLNSHSFKFIKFAFELLRSTLQKNEFLMTPENLDGFMPMIGDAMLSDEEEVQISAIRLISAIIRVDLPAIKNGAGVYIAQCMAFIRACPSTNAELAQASLKLLSSILREKKLSSVKIKDANLAYLLDRVAPDLEEPDRQGVTFNFIKAVLSRKIVIDGVYDIMEEVSRIMVTNQARAVRDSCRGIYFQFVTEYPQGSAKLKKQLQFLAANLEYEHESGRKSVMEAVHLFLTKVGDQSMPEVVRFFFVPLVMSLVNDESAECREMAAALLRKCLERADKESLQSFLNPMKSWLTQREKPMLTRVAVQLYGMYFDAYKADAKGEVPLVSQEILSILEEGSNKQNHTQLSFEPESEDAASWEIIYFSLQTWTKIVKQVLDDGISKKYAQIWTAVQACMSYHHAWVRLVASRLIGLFFGDFKGDLKDIPLRGEHGAEITKDEMISMAKASFGQLRIPELTDELGLQAVRNLVFLARCFYASGAKKGNTNEAESDEENDSENSDNEGTSDEDISGNNELAIHWLINRAAGVVRFERPQQRNVTGKISGLQLLASLTQIISAEDLIPVASKIIMPLYNLIESESEHLKDLKPLAQEILQMLSTRMGTTAYAEAYASVRNDVQTRRRERKHKRSIQLVSDPERAARRKMRKHERSKESKKAKHSAFREMRRSRR